MSVAWWCQACGGTIRRSLLVVRVGPSSQRDRSSNTFCSDGCAEGGVRPDVAPTEVAVEPGRSPVVLTVLEELLSTD